MGAPIKKPGVSLDVKIGQMLMIGFRGMDVDKNSPIMKDIAERHIGGVVIFDEDVSSNRGPRNVESAGQLRRLTGKLRAASALPLFIAVDQEGGRVVREYPNEENVQYDVEFRDRTDCTVHRRLTDLLREFNRRVVGESLLYTRVMPVMESSL